MTGSKKRTPAEAWDALKNMADEIADDEEIERVLALSDEDLDKELADAGLDPEKVRARGQALGEQLARAGASAPAPALAPAPAPAPGAAVVPLRPRRRATLRVLTALAATLCVLALVVGVLPRMRNLLGPENVGDGRKPPPADALRQPAFAACDAQRWAECLRLLDEARTIDPNGDQAPQVKEYRLKAETGLQSTRPAPSH